MEAVKVENNTSNQELNASDKFGDDTYSSEEFLDCEEYCNQQIKDGQKVWQCAVCLLSNFRYKCLLRFHVISIHLRRKGCSWCSSTFDDIQDVIKHCRNCTCKAGEFKKLNKCILEHYKVEGAGNTKMKWSSLSASENETLAKVTCKSDSECRQTVICTDNDAENGIPVHNLNEMHQIKEVCIFSCSRCNQKFSSKKQLRQHSLFGRGCEHHQKQASEDIEDITKSYTIVADKAKKVKWLMYKCIKCGLLFPSQFVVKRHIRRHHWGVKQHTCRVCGKGFFDIATWKYHTNCLLDCRNKEAAIEWAVANDHLIEEVEKNNLKEEGDDDDDDADDGDDKKVFKCRLCAETIVGKETYVTHLRQEIKESPVSKVSCTLCQKMFTNKRGLAYHKNLVHCTLQQKMELCKDNVKKVPRKGGSIKRKMHIKKRVVIRCPICEIVFSNLQEKSDHMGSAHPDGSAIVCNKCQRQYRSIVNLLYHKRVYHVDRNKVYQCAHCSFKTWNKYRLKQHSYRHTVMRDEMYKCEICSLVYDSAASLGRHKLIHANIKNHKCTICGKRFTQKCTLDRHLDSHKNIKRYKCAVCGQKYTQSYPLSKHVKSFHPDMFDTFQKERQTEKWKNNVPDSVKKPSKPATTPKRECVTIVQVPAAQNEAASVQGDMPAPKYRYILMNSAGKIIRPEEESIMEGLLDTDVNNIRKSRILVRNAKAKKDKKKQISIILPPPNKSNVDSPCPDSVDLSASSLQATVFQMIPSTEAMQRTDLADVSFGVDNNPDNRLAVIREPAAGSSEPAGHTLSLDTPSALGTENLDFYLPLEMQETFNNEVDQTLGLSFQNIPEDLWFDFTQTNFDASTLMSSSYSLLGLNNQEGDQLNLDSGLADSAAAIDPAAPLSFSSHDTMDTTTPTNEPNIVLPTLQDIPSWTGDQMLLVQEGDKSYLISANNLAHLDGINITNPSGTNTNAAAALPSTSFDSTIPVKEASVLLSDQAVINQESVFVMPNSDTKEVVVPQLRGGETLRTLLNRK